MKALYSRDSSDFYTAGHLSDGKYLFGKFTPKY